MKTLIFSLMILFGAAFVTPDLHAAPVNEAAAAASVVTHSLIGPKYKYGPTSRGTHTCLNKKGCTKPKGVRKRSHGKCPAQY